VRTAWLSLTPEPERELPWAVAVLRHGAPPGPDAVERERARVEAIVVSGSERDWLRYLDEALSLALRRPAGGVETPEAADAREVAVDVIRNHHRLTLGLPGRTADRTAAQLALLEGASETREGP
jgi:hypothetical protein